MGRRLGLLACVCLLVVAAPREGAAASCVSYLPDSTGFPVVMLASGEADITITKPDTPTNSFHTTFHQQITFQSPVDEATLVFGTEAPTLFQACDGSFPPASKQHAGQGDVFNTLTTVMSNGSVITVTQDGFNYVPANDGNCPIAQCVSDAITYTNTLMYELRTGRYTLAHTARRDFVSLFGTTRTTSHSTVSGTLSGLMTIPNLPKLVIQPAPGPLLPSNLDPTFPATKRLDVFCTSDGLTTSPRVPCSWELKISPAALSAADDGHFGPHTSDRPLGALVLAGSPIASAHKRGCRQDALTNADCAAKSGAAVTSGHVWFVAPEVSGRIVVEGSCPTGSDSCLGEAVDLDVAVPGLVDVRFPGPQPIAVVPDSRHGVEAPWTHPDLAARLRIAAGRFFAETGFPLTLTDVGLPWGGLYDIKGPSDPGLDWTPPHSSHRYGIDADVRINYALNPVNQVIRLHLRTALESVGLWFQPGEDPTTAGASHWHVRPFVHTPPGFPPPSTASPLTRSTATAASCPVASNLLTPTLHLEVSRDADTDRYDYTYRVANASSSQQPLRAWQVVLNGAVDEASSPAGWTASILATPEGTTVVRWAATQLETGWVDDGVGVPPALNAIAPGTELAGFIIRSPQASGRAPYAAFGESPLPPPIAEEDMEDFLTNCAASSIPVGGDTFGPSSRHVQYLAEGATGVFFDTSIAVLNAGLSPASVQFRFLKDDGTTVTHQITVPAGTRRTVRPATLEGLASANFSTVIESDALVIVDRTMTWGGGYGSHGETALASPSTTWYLAEGSTTGDFHLFYLLQNPNSEPVMATIRYLLPDGGTPVERTYTLPPNSRTTIYVNQQGGVLASTDVSAVITATHPIIAERAMYINKPGQPFAAGHESAGVTAPALEWFLAEGATGPFFDLFILIANPNPTPAQVTADYLLLGGGVVTKSYTVPGNGRFTIYVDAEEAPAGSGQHPFGNVAVSTTIRSTNNVPVIVERAMWWPGPELTSNFWYEAHNSPGARATATRWALAEGEIGGPTRLETYVLIANTSPGSGSARVTLHFEDGTTAQRVYALEPSSRTNVQVAADFPSAAGRTFGVIVESLGATPAQIVVERAMYSSLGDVLWAAGTNALGTPIP